MASSIGIGNLNTESIELNTSALNLHNRIPVDPSLIHGNDIYLAPTGGFSYLFISSDIFSPVHNKLGIGRETT